MTTNYERIKKMSIDEMAEYIRNECVDSLMQGFVYDEDKIKQWLNQEVENDD